MCRILMIPCWLLLVGSANCSITFATSPTPEESLKLADELFQAKKYEESAKQLTALILQYRESAIQARALYRLARVQLAQGADKAAFATFEQGEHVFAKLTGDATWAVANDNGRRSAAKVLAKHAMLKKRWTDALCCWEAWFPLSFCGNAIKEMHVERAIGQAECLINLQRPAEAAKVLKVRTIRLYLTIHCGQRVQEFVDLCQSDKSGAVLANLRDALREFEEEAAAIPIGAQEAKARLYSLPKSHKR